MAKSEKARCKSARCRNCSGIATTGSIVDMHKPQPGLLRIVSRARGRFTCILNFRALLPAAQILSKHAPRARCSSQKCRCTATNHAAATHSTASADAPYGHPWAFLLHSTIQWKRLCTRTHRRHTTCSSTPCACSLAPMPRRSPAVLMIRSHAAPMPLACRSRASRARRSSVVDVLFSRAAHMPLWCRSNAARAPLARANQVSRAFCSRAAHVPLMCRSRRRSRAARDTCQKKPEQNKS